MGRVVTETELVELIAEDRHAGRSIAFANGCFDVLHVGHARYLEGASREANRLVVGVNDDASVRALKGSGRPIMPAADRAELVAAFGVVDYVVVGVAPRTLGRQHAARVLVAALAQPPAGALPGPAPRVARARAARACQAAVARHVTRVGGTGSRHDADQR